MTRRIRADDLRGIPGLTSDAVSALILRQPKTVAEAIRIPRVGRRTARRLLEAGLLTDAEGAMQGGVDALQAIAPSGKPLNDDFMAIVRDGTGRVFELAHNARWLENTRPIVEAFLHARFFLEMAVLHGQVIERPPAMLPSGWASLLYLHGLR